MLIVNEGAPKNSTNDIHSMIVDDKNDIKNSNLLPFHVSLTNKYPNIIIHELLNMIIGVLANASTTAAD